MAYPVANAVIEQMVLSKEGRIVGLDRNGGLWRLLYPGENPETQYWMPTPPPSGKPAVTKHTWEGIDCDRYLPS